jgi:hypothetical protein
VLASQSFSPQAQAAEFSPEPSPFAQMEYLRHRLSFLLQNKPEVLSLSQSAIPHAQLEGLRWTPPILAQVGIGCEEHILVSALQYSLAEHKTGVFKVPHAHAAPLGDLPSSFWHVQQVAASVSLTQGSPTHMTCEAVRPFL